MVALSVLDLAVVPDGGTSAGALADTTKRWGRLHRVHFRHTIANAIPAATRAGRGRKRPRSA